MNALATAIIFLVAFALGACVFESIKVVIKHFKTK